MKAVTRNRIAFITASAAIVVLAIFAVRLSPLGAFIRDANEWSAIMSLQHELESQVDSYHAQHGRYPDSLRVLTIDYSKTDQATPAHLDEFLYQPSDTGYHLTPKRRPHDATHRRASPQPNRSA